MSWFLAFFFVSGFCSLLYELIWLRLAMAQFGVTSAMVSLVLSMFMAGLGLGSWGSGWLIRRYGRSFDVPALRFYALAELLIGVSAVTVPREFALGRTLLAGLGLNSSWAYYLGSGVWIALTLVPWCAFIGATIPVAMVAIRASFPREAQRSFSYLYLANVCGAVAGASVPVLLIEICGFHGTLKIGAVLNTLLAATAFTLSLRPAKQGLVAPFDNSSLPASLPPLRNGNKWVLALLFGTGCTSMGIEVVWIRQFTPYLGTVVYAFASILSLYLIATFIGSRIYRRWSRGYEPQTALLWALLGFCALFSSVTASPQFHLPGLLRVVLGIAPFSGILGFVTPMLVDRWSEGDPEKAGSAYAMNVLGCIVGQLLSGFVLLPLISERWVVFVFCMLWLLIGVAQTWSSEHEGTARKGRRSQVLSSSIALLAILLVFVSKGFEDQFPKHEILRDNTATIVATTDGRGKRLLVNGVGMTYLSPMTKLMAHLPLAFLDHPPQSALVICFGMGTTFRSLLSWNIQSTAVELVPSVPRMFWYYHPDGPQLLQSPLSHVVIDDGRRYLERTSAHYDVITLDPPPPVEAAGSSLLYSKEFYLTVKQHLTPHGILHQWLPYGDAVVDASFARALKESFAYVRAFHSLTGGRRLHFLASNEPIPNRTSDELVQHMPAAAVEDLMEWGPAATPEREFAAVLGSEITLDAMIAEAPNVPALQDDRPANEYYWLRHRLGSELVQHLAELENGGALRASR
jgi:predicted membrane-bound spermidine synthase